jgi:two-component system, NarL family, sensor histidine kinase BarA
MIRNWGIRTRVLLLALVPVISLGFVLGTYLTQVRVHDLHASVHALGDTLANQLASASEYGVFTNNVRILQTLAQTVSREPGVESITIADRDGHILTQVNHPVRDDQGLISSTTQDIGMGTGLENTLTFTRPIFLQTVPTGESSVLQHESSKSRSSLIDQHQVLGKVTVKLSEAHFAERQTQIIVNGGIIMLSCLALSILLALIIGGSVSAPITRVIDMVSRFSSGDHTVRVNENSGGEIGQLESGINLMAENAERSQQELQAQVNQATSELRETMDEMEVKNVELDLARKRALEASRAKSSFLSNMSHEIRTPMNAIVGFAGLLAKSQLTRDQRNYLDTVQNSAATLLNLIDDVLGLQSLEAGKSVRSAPFNLRELLEQAVTLLAPEAYRKQLELILYLPVDLPTAYVGDAVKISRVIINLLSNAVKFTDHGQIEVSARALKRSAQAITLNISVKDTGIGIRQEHIKELFTPFTMFNNTDEQHHTGTGLGLAISRQLMQTLGGSLSVFSSYGEGSEFRMELALDICPEQPLVAAKAGRALIYESHPDMLTALWTRLEGLGFEVKACNSLKALVMQLRSAALSRFDLLMLSLNYDEIRDCSKFADIKTGNKLPEVLLLVNSLERKVQQEIAESVGGVCAPKCVDTRTLEKKIHELVPRLSSEHDTKHHPRIIVSQPLIGRRILIVEDNRVNRRLIGLQLRGLGADVVQAEDGNSAVTCFVDSRPDAVLLDMRLGSETGLEVAERLVQTAGERPVPILILSAVHEEISIERSKMLGIRRWLLKPVDEMVLAAALLEVIDTTQSRARTIDEPPKESKMAIENLRPEILKMLRQDLPNQLRAISTAWSLDDTVNLKEALHMLHGTAAMCKFSKLESYCLTMETNLLGKKSMESISSVMPKLKDELLRIIDLLRTDKHAADNHIQNLANSG